MQLWKADYIPALDEQTHLVDRPPCIRKRRSDCRLAELVSISCRSNAAASQPRMICCTVMLCDQLRTVGDRLCCD
jgi:hypothetical protein